MGDKDITPKEPDAGSTKDGGGEDIKQPSRLSGVRRLRRVQPVQRVRRVKR